MSMMIISAIGLGLLGAFCAVILFFVAKKFEVQENPQVEEINSLLPQANCGACGQVGCKQFALKIVENKTLEGFYCPVGGQTTMDRIATTLGVSAQLHEKKVAVLRCQGSREAAPDKIDYHLVPSCRLRHQQNCGMTACPHGCLRGGDCVRVCKFDALYFDEIKGLPVVIEDKCTACGACLKACPRLLFELRTAQDKVYVACMNQEKGVIAKKNCSQACIGCQKCVRLVANPDLAFMGENLATLKEGLDSKVWGEQLAQACPTKAILYKKTGGGK